MKKEERIFFAKKEEEEPYLEELFGNPFHMLISFVWSRLYPVYPTYRACFKEFRPPVILRIDILDTY